jgi:hypothetical protein
MGRQHEDVPTGPLEVQPGSSMVLQFKEVHVPSMHGSIINTCQCKVAGGPWVYTNRILE